MEPRVPSLPPDAQAWAAHGADDDAVARLRDRATRGLTSGWVANWAARPADPALIAGGPAAPDEPAGTLTNEQLEDLTAVLAARLAGQGVRPGDRVLLSAPPSVALIGAYLAVLRLGAVALPVNPAYHQAEFTHAVLDARPRLAIVARAEQGRWARAADPAITIVDTRLDVADGPRVPLDQATGADPALLLYTSGTTGTAKGAPLSHGNLVASAEALRIAWRWTPADRLLLTLPLFHLHGLGVGLHGTLQAGASLTVLGAFDADAVVTAARSGSASLFFGVPTMYHRLAAHPRADALAGLRLLVSGSAALDPELFARLAEVSGHRVLERYGMTETVMNVSNPHDGDRRPGTIGLALPGVQVRLAGPQGDDGEAAIEVRGPNVFAGYWKRPDADAQAFTADGWFRTGDLGAVDEHGYLRIVGRAKELIISGGFNIHPREVEECLLTHPSVAEVAVVGVPSTEWGEVVVAHVVVAAGQPEPVAAELIDHVAARLAPYKKPRHIVFTDRLPRNALGKVTKGELPSASF